MSNSNSDNLFNGLIGKALNEGINSTNEKNNSAAIRLFLAVAGILLFVGAEAVKIVYRKNFGIKGINMFRLIICFLCFLGIGILCISVGLSGEMENKGYWFTDSSFVVCGAAYVILSFYLLRKGILERIKATRNQVYTEFTGEPDLLNFLKEYGWSRNKIQYLAEPGYTLILGIVLAAYNPLAAIPVVFCAISVWAHAVLEFVFLQNPFQPNIQPQQQFEQPQQAVKPNRVNTDF